MSQCVEITRSLEIQKNQSTLCEHYDIESWDSIYLDLMDCWETYCRENQVCVTFDDFISMPHFTDIVTTRRNCNDMITKDSAVKTRVVQTS